MSRSCNCPGAKIRSALQNHAWKRMGHEPYPTGTQRLIDGAGSAVITMTRLVVAKFGGSAIGPDGASIPQVVKRIGELAKDSKVVAVFSAPLTIHDGKKRSLTDVVLEQGRNAEAGNSQSLDTVRSTYERILGMVSAAHREDCMEIVKSHLAVAQKALDEAFENRMFADEVRAKALAFSGEILMSHVMSYILKSNNMQADTVGFDDWPIVTDDNVESANFMAAESRKKMGRMAEMLSRNEVVSIGGFIGRTADGTITTYERGGTDRTAADIGILFHKMYDTRINFEKDNAVVSADPKIVSSHLRDIPQMSYNEARLAGMFGMKILDPVAIKEVVENGVDMPITITDMNHPEKITTIQRMPEAQKTHPIKIVVGKGNCAIFRIEAGAVHRLLASLARDRRYSEFVILSPFIKDDIEFFRILFLDGDYVRRNEKYLLSFDPLAAIRYDRGVITLIGDEMWRVQQVASRTSARIGLEGLNILNMDAQEETSRIIIVIEDAGDNIRRAIIGMHQEITAINSD